MCDHDKNSDITERNEKEADVLHSPIIQTYLVLILGIVSSRFFSIYIGID